uniref:Uncharacterized protein n=1 Tax=Micrurus spixii TaxID=129469 RepID=A0A2D4LYE2_9SAUR
MNYMKTPRKKSKELGKNTSHIFTALFFHKSDKESLLFKSAHNLKYRCDYFYIYIFAVYKYESFHILNNTLECCSANGERYKCQWAINYLQTNLLLHPISLFITTYNILVVSSKVKSNSAFMFQFFIKSKLFMSC